MSTREEMFPGVTAVILPPQPGSFHRVAGLPLLQRLVLGALRGGFQAVIVLEGSDGNRVRRVLRGDPRTATIPVVSENGLAQQVRTEWVVLLPSDCLVAPAAMQRVREADAGSEAILIKPLHAAEGCGMLRCRREVLPQLGSIVHGEFVEGATPGVLSPEFGEHLTTSPEPSPGRRGAKMFPLPAGEGQGEGMECRTKHNVLPRNSFFEPIMHDTSVVSLDARECLRVCDAATARAAEEHLLTELRNSTTETDGPLARLDRGLSTRLSRWLVRTPLRPNHITTIGTVIGLLGAWSLAGGTYAGGVAGAALFWCAVILDGCDGEVARLKFLETRWGGLYDVVTDNVVHVAIFVGLVAGCYRSGSSGAVWVFAFLLLGGFACALLATYFCLLRHPPVNRLRPRSRRGRLRRSLLQGFEAVMNRDFAYLLLAFALAGHLAWFVWGATLGSYAYAAGLVAVYLWRDAP